MNFILIYWFCGRNKIENLLCHNTELSAKYEKSINKEEKLSKEIQTKAQEVYNNIL